MSGPRVLNSLAEMAEEFLTLEVGTLIALDAGLGAILAKIEKTAKSEFGHYQPAVGAFPAWPELADRTKDERVRLGFTENDPLRRSGELLNSISKEKHALEGVVGSTSEVMVWQEFGTKHIPARPVLGPAAVRNKDAMMKLAAACVVAGFIGQDQVAKTLGLTNEESAAFGADGHDVHPALGYSFKA